MINPRFKILMKFCISLVVFFYICSISANATQTIFNVPSADVTKKGDIFLLEGVQTTPWSTKDAFLSTTFWALGVGHNTEIDSILFNVASPDNNNITLSFGFKSSIPVPILVEKFPKREIKLTVGSLLLLGVEGNGVGNWTYTHLSGRVPKLNTRLTAGISYGTRQVFGKDITSFIAGVEQPITKKLNLLGDWYSGSEHWAGYLIVGGSYVLCKNTVIYLGYTIPNGPKVGRGGFIFQISKIF